MTSRAKRRNSLVALLMATACLPVSAGAAEARAPADPLVTAFSNPPNSARPRVWWHWMNGNITEAGIDKDLEWMHRVGLGGLQNFDAALSTPQIVDKRLVYMTPEWKQAFRHAVQRADALGLEFGIAASPGWSETGGPWVPPRDGMKKLVWSETVIVGGKPFTGALPAPPAVSGPYQDRPRGAQFGEVDKAPPPPTYYADSAVLAYPLPARAAFAEPASADSNGKAVDLASLTDGSLDTGVPTPSTSSAGPGFVELSYQKPQTVRSAAVFVSNIAGNPLAGPPVTQLEASDDGKAWRRITELPLTNVPTTASFAPVTAARFRLVFSRAKGVDRSSFTFAPGIDVSSLMSMGGGGGEPQRLTDFRLMAEPRVNAFEQKAGFAIADNYYALDADAGPDVTGVAPSEVIDLTGKMTADGRLDWTPPPGRWKVVRLGYSLTGTTNHPATAEATGLEVDKFDAGAVGRYLESYLATYRSAVGEDLMGARGLHTLVTDSTEVGPSNWTPRILEQFQRLRGYDPRPWLPALTGELIGSRSQSDAFLYDYRRTLAELTASEHYGTVAKVAHAHGMIVYGESLEGTRTFSSLGDDLEMRRFADIPMGALWTYGKSPSPGHVGDIRGAASVAHLYGQPYVAAESLTSIAQPWALTPADLQPMIDAEFVNGVNRPVIHSSVHQPVDDKVPGLTLMVFGQYFNRNETWAEMAKPWIDYISRNSYLLQQGRNVADVGYLYGEETPIGVQASAGYPRDVPKRYAYDFVPPDAVLNELTVAGGEIVSKGGARYKALYLGGLSQQMTLPMLRRLAALVDAGATLVGEAPVGTPSRADDKAEFTSLVTRLWQGARVTRVGQGRVVASKDIEAALAASGLAPDFSYQAKAPDADIQFVHRRLADGDLYYVSNRTRAAQSLDARFRVEGKAAEIWRADSGLVEPASYRIASGATAVPLELRAGESLFVVFRQPATALARSVPKPTAADIAELGGAWDVAFQPGRGAKATLRLPALASLSNQADPGVKYFSGVATYSRSFTLPKTVKPGAPLWLDLGQIGDVAEVRVNGRLAGTAWKAPYRVQVGPLVHAGRNALEIRVANLWVNRLIGDQQPGAQKVTFTTIKTFTPRAPLRPSGLIGPVKLVAER